MFGNTYELGSMKTFRQDVERWAQQAELALWREAWEEAAEALQQALCCDRTAGARLQPLAEILAGRTAAAGTDAQAAAAQAALGRVCLARGKAGYQAARTCLEKARTYFGADFQQAVDLLHVYRGLGHVREFADYAWEVVEQGCSPELATAIGAETEPLAREHPQDAKLALLLGVCQLELRCYEEAARHLERAAFGDIQLAACVLHVYQRFCRGGEPSPLLNLAVIRLLRQMNRPDNAWEILQQTAELLLTDSERTELCGLLAEAADSSRDPTRYRLLTRCLLEAEDAPAALRAAWNWRNTAAAVWADDLALCHELTEHCRKAACDNKTQASALRLAAEVAARAGQPGPAVEYLRSLTALPALEAGDLEGALALIEILPDPARNTPEAGWVLAQLLVRLGRREAAAGQLVGLIADSSPASLLTAAAEQLEGLLSGLADPAIAIAAQARAYLTLGNLDRARSLVLECVQGPADLADDILTRLQAAVSVSAGKGADQLLLIDACLVAAREPWLSCSLAEAKKLFRESKNISLALNWERLAAACQQVAEADPAAARDCVLVLTQGLRRADAVGKGCLRLARARIRARSTDDAGRVLTDLRRAGESSSPELLKAVVETCMQLAQQHPPLAAAILVALRIEVGQDRGLQLLPLLLQRGNGFSQPQVAALQQAIRTLRAKWPQSGLAIVAEARIASWQGDAAGALALYRQALGQADPEQRVLPAIAEDLPALCKDPLAGCEATFLLADIQLGLNAPDRARALLVQRAEKVPADAAACLQRLQDWAQRPAALWRDRLAWAYALWLTHAEIEAWKVLRAAIDADGVDWAEVGSLAAKMDGMLGSHWVSRAIRIAVDVRSLPAPALIRPLKQIRILLNPSEHLAVSVLNGLLEDCQVVMLRVGGLGRLLRRAAKTRICLLERQQRMRDAALELESWVAHGPRFAGLVLAECNAHILYEPIYHLPAAAACLARKDLSAGLQHLRELLQAGPECAAEVARLLEELRRVMPQNMEIHLELMAVRLRQGPEAYATLVDDAGQLCRVSPQDGPGLVRDFLVQHIDPDSPPPILVWLRCQVEAAEGRFDECIAGLRRLRQLADKHELEKLRKESASLITGTLPVGVTLSLAEHSGPQAPNAVPACVRLFLAELAYDAGDWDDAARHYALVLELPGEPDASRAAIQQGLEAILRQSHQAGAAWIAKGMIATHDREADRAAVCYRQAAEAGHDADVREPLTALCQAFPQVSRPFLILGEVHLRAQELEPAAACLRRAADGDDLPVADRVFALRLLAECLAAGRNFAQALGILTAANQLAPDDADTAAQLWQTDLLWRADRVAALTKARDQDPRPIRDWELGCALRDNGEYAAALGRFQQGLADPSLGLRCQLEMAKCQMLLQHANLAVPILRRALLQAADIEIRKEILYQLGVAFSRLLKFNQAIESFEELLSWDAGYRDAADRLQAVYLSQLSGAEFLIAEIPFDLLDAWRRLDNEKRRGSTEGGTGS